MSLTPERRRRIEQVYRAALELEAGRCHAFLVQSSAGDEELRRELEAVQATQGGGFASSESTDGKWLYFTRDLASESSLWKKPVGGGEEVQVLPSVTYANFAVVNDGIYYVTKSAQGPAIELLNFARGKSEMVAPIGKGYVGFSLSPDRKWILVAQDNPEGSELVLVEGFR
jgi:Tol biopolymer transport system component